MLYWYVLLMLYQLVYNRKNIVWDLRQPRYMRVRTE